MAAPANRWFPPPATIASYACEGNNAMNSTTNAATVHLRHGQSLALPDIQGTAFMVTRGTLWITQENDTQDVVLRAGDLWMVERDGLTIIEAQNDASMQAVGPTFERATRARGDWLHWLRDKAAAFFDVPLRRPLPYY